MIKLGLIILFGLQLALPAEAISRIGTSRIGDKTEGFIARVDDSFILTKPIEDGGLILTAPQALSSPTSGVSPSQLKVTRFRLEFPELVSLSRTAFREAMANRHSGWTHWNTGKKCPEVYTYRGREITTVLATWGEGRGIVVSTGVSLYERQSLRELILSLELEKGACSWK